MEGGGGKSKERRGINSKGQNLDKDTQMGEQLHALLAV